MPQPSIFISYSHQDEVWKDRLVQQLGVLEGEGLFTVWHDRKIGLGQDWFPEIERAIQAARVAILLISANFLTSDFIKRKEIPEFLRRRQEEGLLVVPVIVRSCPWKRVGWLAAIQARPLDGNPLSGLADWEDKLTQLVYEIDAHLQATSVPPEETFLDLYRRAMSPLFSSWDLGNVGVTQTGGAGAPIEARLDDMYLPLRLAEGFDLRKTKEGKTIAPKNLLKRKKPLVIRGAAGSGKTTWMRWTFRRLLEHPSAFPLMLILRDLAIPWSRKDLQGKGRSLDHFMEDWVAEQLGRDCREELRQQLAARHGPRPVLLVDGWDEIGPLGEKLRDKLLGLMQRYPRFLVVVTSRPYGEGRPSHSEGFDLLDIQPLAEGEIQALATRFFTRCYGEDPKKAGQEVERFRRSLERAPEPQALARNALLLTMMLLIARSRPLPDKRHLLYQACIENLLTALPDRKAEEGALILHHQWRPDDSEERLRVLAELAFRLQTEYDSSFWWQVSGLPIVKSWDEMAALLPTEIPERRRFSFLAWLAGPAGLLNDRSDGTLSFTHLSFQEYLSAWHLNVTMEGDQRLQGFEELLQEEAWWETLRLWAALLGSKNPALLEKILAELSERDDVELSLVGCMLADGIGSEVRFRKWLSRLGERLSRLWPDAIARSGQAWAASRQEARRVELRKLLETRVLEAGWLGWLRGQEFARLAALKLELPDDSSKVVRRAAVQQLSQQWKEQESAWVAASRLLNGGPPLWPNSPQKVGLLHIWPSYRRLAGMRLQLAVACGASRKDLYRPASRLLLALSPKDSTLTQDLARQLAQELPRDLARDLARYWAREWTRDWTQDRTIYWTRGLARDWAKDWKRYLAVDWASDWTRYAARDWTRYLAQAWARDRASQWAEELALAWTVSPQSEWLINFSIADLLSLGRAGARSLLATEYLKSLETALLSPACRLSLHPDSDPAPFQEALARHAPRLDPLWPALARHVARLSTREDRALLEDLAQNPERRKPPLRWGLQFIVRGDVMLEDGTIITLDELADEAGVPRLPFLDEMPDELEVDWEKNEDAPESQ